LDFTHCVVARLAPLKMLPEISMSINKELDRKTQYTIQQSSLEEQKERSLPCFSQAWMLVGVSGNSKGLWWPHLTLV